MFTVLKVKPTTPNHHHYSKSNSRAGMALWILMDSELFSFTKYYYTVSTSTVVLGY